MTKQENIKLKIYQGKNGEIEVSFDENEETFWLSQKQIAQIFDIDRTVITKHINKIFKDNELNKNVVSAKFAHTTKHGAIKDKTQIKNINFYNLDVVLAVGYKVNSKKAVEFRKWATQTLKKHITKGYTINENFLKKKEDLYLQVMEDIKKLSSNNQNVSNEDIIELIKSFSSTWFNLETYDKQNLPTSGFTQKDISLSIEKLYKEIQILKQELINKKEASALFAKEKNIGNLEGIFGNVMQTVFGGDAYKTIEEKAAHLLYFIVKNHPFNDGNKRVGAFSFIWFLKNVGYDFTSKINPSSLTTLTLLIAESNPKEKERMIGLVLLLLK